MGGTGYQLHGKTLARKLVYEGSWEEKFNNPKLTLIEMTPFKHTLHFLGNEILL